MGVIIMTYEQILNLLKEFEGVIGAIFGSLLGIVGTMITTQYLKNKGNIRVVLIDSIYNIYGWVDGYYKDDIDFENASGLSLDFNIELYNESESPKYLNNFNIELFDVNGEKLIRLELDSLDSKRLAAGAIRYDSISYINVEPKKIMKQGFHCNVSFENNDHLKNFKKICFNYTDVTEKVNSILVVNVES